MNLGNKIVRLRKEKNLSHEDLGKLAGTSAAIIGQYERNDITPSVEVAAKIAGALDILLDYPAGNSTVIFKKNDL